MGLDTLGDYTIRGITRRTGSPGHFYPIALSARTNLTSIEQHLRPARRRPMPMTNAARARDLHTYALRSRASELSIGRSPRSSPCRSRCIIMRSSALPLSSSIARFLLSLPSSAVAYNSSSFSYTRTSCSPSRFLVSQRNRFCARLPSLSESATRCAEIGAAPLYLVPSSLTSLRDAYTVSSTER